MYYLGTLMHLVKIRTRSCGSPPPSAVVRFCAARICEREGGLEEEGHTKHKKEKSKKGVSVSKLFCGCYTRPI